MAASAVILGGAAIGGAQAHQQRKARKEAQAAADVERAQIEALQREITAQAAEKPMPTPDDDAARRAKRRSVAGTARRRGRQSTILTSGTGVTGDSLG